MTPPPMDDTAPVPGADLQVNDGCCALDPGHEGPCEWVCDLCNGTGRCPDCIRDCRCDDVVVCEYCDGLHACPHCHEGRLIDE